MTVAELIAALSAIPQDFNVEVFNNDTQDPMEIDYVEPQTGDGYPITSFRANSVVIYVG